jgi:hypothetical protein
VPGRRRRLSQWHAAAQEKSRLGHFVGTCPKRQVRGQNSERDPCRKKRPKDREGWCRTEQTTSRNKPIDSPFISWPLPVPVRSLLLCLLSAHPRHPAHDEFLCRRPRRFHVLQPHRPRGHGPRRPPGKLFVCCVADERACSPRATPGPAGPNAFQPAHVRSRLRRPSRHARNHAHIVHAHLVFLLGPLRR